MTLRKRARKTTETSTKGTSRTATTGAKKAAKKVAKTAEKKGVKMFTLDFAANVIWRARCQKCDFVGIECTSRPDAAVNALSHDVKGHKVIVVTEISR